MTQHSATNPTKGSNNAHTDPHRHNFPQSLQEKHNRFVILARREHKRDRQRLSALIGAAQAVHRPAEVIERWAVHWVSAENNMNTKKEATQRTTSRTAGRVKANNPRLPAIVAEKHIALPFLHHYRNERLTPAVFVLARLALRGLLPLRERWLWLHGKNVVSSTKINK
jgi:hypothetical protein